MDFILSLTIKTIGQVWLTLLHNWPYLVLSVTLAVALKLYLDPQRISAFLLRHQKAGVVGATAVAVTTPLCSCGTTAIVLGMIANYLPWAPIVAFMVASPLTSPEELIYSAGLFGWRFAGAFFAASILLGLLGGLLAGVADRRGWLANQVRQSLSAAEALQPAPQPPVFAAGAAFVPMSSLLLEPACCAVDARIGVLQPALQTAGCGCEPASAGQPATAGAACACDADANPSSRPVTLRLFLDESLLTGRRLLVMFLGFAFIGYFLNGLIPASWVAALFGSGNVYSVPLAATLGLPLYVNTEASLPLVRAMLDAGMSEGAALAFLITGAGTSFGAVAGMMTIARWRVVGLVVGTLWAGAVLSGILYNWVF